MADSSWTRRDLLRAGIGAAALGALGAGCSGPRLVTNVAFTKEDIAFGPEPMQTAQLTLPRSTKRRPVAILVHGGYWRVGFTRDEMADLAQDLARVGYASWNLDYRRVGDPGGGYPGTVLDIASGVDKLAEIAPDRNLDLERVVVLGHSAGAQLGCWIAARRKLPPVAVGVNPQVKVRAVVSLSGVLDLVTAVRPPTEGEREAELRRAVTEFLGGTPETVPDRYAHQSPIQLLPLGVPQLLLHGSKDDRVPLSQSRSYLGAAANAGDTVKLIELPNVDHFDVVKSTKAWWDEVLSWLDSVVGDPLL